MGGAGVIYVEEGIVELGIEGKVALVAAASRGLGRATAQALSAEGARVAIAARGRDQLERTAQEIEAETRSSVLAIPCDVTIPKELSSLVARVDAAWGGVDILVTNAGGPPPGNFGDIDDADWNEAVRLNLLSAVRLIRLVLNHMRERRWGRIINLTSISVKQPLPNLILSNSIRAAVVGMAKTLADEVADEGITVNNICPGYMLTDRVQQLAEAEARKLGENVETVTERSRQEIPVGRLGRPQELGALVAFLASCKAGYITGASIPIDGGYYRGLL